MDDPKIISALIAAGVATLGFCLTFLSQLVFRYLDKYANRQHELLKYRRTALLKALEVLDHVYSNLPISGMPPANPHLWDLSEAHDAMNGMIIYCKDPSTAVDSFNAALGVDSVGEFYPMDNLEKFRHVVCDELGLARTNYQNKDVIWISGLAGSSLASTSAVEAKSANP